jgi:glucosamine kinase
VTASRPAVAEKEAAPQAAMVLGLDIGGTHTRARLACGGSVLGEAMAPSASLTAAGKDRATEAFTSIFTQLGLGPGAGLAAICAGTAGTGAVEADSYIRDMLAPLTAGGPVVVVNDARLVLAAAGVDDGIACVAGTGSIAVGLVGDREERAGGWGYLLGDEGSGYWIVRKAVRELASRHDSHAAPGKLGEVILEGAGCQDLASLIQLWHDRPAPDAWAALAPLVLDCGDPWVPVVTEGAASALATPVSLVFRRLGKPPGLPVVLGGGLLTRHSGMAAATQRAIEASSPGAWVMVLAQEPVVGAVRLALAAAAGAATR